MVEANRRRRRIRLVNQRRIGIVDVEIVDVTSQRVRDSSLYVYVSLFVRKRR